MFSLCLRLLARALSIGGALSIARALPLGCALAVLAAMPAAASELIPGGYYWYAPDHEKYAQTEFFSQPSFRSPHVRINRTQRFRYAAGKRGWAQLEFDGGTQAYVHLRILRSLIYDPGAVDPWHEFQRASVFPEEPAKIEARLKPPSLTPPAADSKVPVWKRYKEGWSIYKGREPERDPERAATTPEKKPRLRPLPPTAAPADEPAATEARDPAEPLPAAR